MLDYHSTLSGVGFTPRSYDFESSIIGWSYDIEFALFDSASPFDNRKSQIIRCWDNPEAHIHTILVPVDGDIAGATRFLLDRWYSELRYDIPILEVILTQSSGNQSVVRILVMSKSNAMTLKFTIQRESI
jgi:hypothetical protein